MSNLTEVSLAEMTEKHWEIAHAIAQSLVKDGTDVNELGKAIAYLRSILNESDAGDRFFKYLKPLSVTEDKFPIVLEHWTTTAALKQPVAHSKHIATMLKPYCMS